MSVSADEGGTRQHCRVEQVAESANGEPSETPSMSAGQPSATQELMLDDTCAGGEKYRAELARFKPFSS